MSFVSSNDLSTGITVLIDNDLLQVVEFQHVKPGKGSPFVRAKLKNIITGYARELTFRGGEKLARAHIERRKATFLYAADEEYTFMDIESFEQFTAQEELIGVGKKWLTDNMEVDLVFHDDAIIGLELPNFVELVVTETEPGHKGDTATGATKNATVSTGAVIAVPLFVEVGTKLQIDTRTGAYMRRV
jgi:elongation factor P